MNIYKLCHMWGKKSELNHIQPWCLFFSILCLSSPTVFPPHISPFLLTVPFISFPLLVPHFTTSQQPLLWRQTLITLTHFPTLLTPLFPSAHKRHTFYYSATPFLTCKQIQRCSSGSGEGTSGSAPLVGNMSCHGLCQFSSIQSLSALSVYIGCLQLLSQCGTGARLRTFILCGLPSPMLPSHFLFNTNEIVEQGSGKFISHHSRWLGKHRENNYVLNAKMKLWCIPMVSKTKALKQS